MQLELHAVLTLALHGGECSSASVHTDYEAGWTAESVWTLRWRA